MFSKICFPLLGQNCYFDNDLQFEVISIVLVTNDFEHVIIRRKFKPYKEVNIIPIYNEQKFVAQSHVDRNIYAFDFDFSCKYIKKLNFHHSVMSAKKTTSS